MDLRFSTTATLALAAIAIVSTDASAQRSSDTRINVRKGEVAQPRVDTVYQTRIDTVFRTRADTVFVTRRDTTYITREVPAAAVVAPVLPLGRAYFGINGGGVIPTNALDNSHAPGWQAGVIMGWDAARVPLGLRFDGGYSQFGEESAYAGGLAGGCTPSSGVDCSTIGDPAMWHGNFNVKLGVPFTVSAFRPYLTGGATYNRFRGFTFVDDDQNNAIVQRSDDWHDKWGGNIGGGLEFGWGRTNLYLEGRFQTMNIGFTTQNHVPIVLGIKF